MYDGEVHPCKSWTAEKISIRVKVWVNMGAICGRIMRRLRKAERPSVSILYSITVRQQSDAFL